MAIAGLLLVIGVEAKATMIESLSNDSVKLEFRGNQEFAGSKRLFMQRPFTLALYGASWCGYCRSEVVPLTKLQLEFANDLTVIAISGDDTEIESMKMHEVWGTQWPLFWDSQHQIKRQFAVGKIPHLFLLDPRGQVLMEHATTGQLKEFLQEIRLRITKILAEAKN